MRNQLLGLQFLVLIEHLVEVEPRLKVAEPAERERLTINGRDTKISHNHHN